MGAGPLVATAAIGAATSGGLAIFDLKQKQKAMKNSFRIQEAALDRQEADELKFLDIRSALRKKELASMLGSLHSVAGVSVKESTNEILAKSAADATATENFIDAEQTFSREYERRLQFALGKVQAKAQMKSMKINAASQVFDSAVSLAQAGVTGKANAST